MGSPSNPLRPLTPVVNFTPLSISPPVPQAPLLPWHPFLEAQKDSSLLSGSLGRVVRSSSPIPLSIQPVRPLPTLVGSVTPSSSRDSPPASPRPSRPPTGRPYR